MDAYRVVETYYFWIEGIDYEVEGRIVELLNADGTPTGKFISSMSNRHRPSKGAASPYSISTNPHGSFEEARRGLFADAKAIERYPEGIEPTESDWFKRGND